MSRREKLEQRLRRKPSPKDFTWDDWVTLAKGYGFTVHCQGGSHHTFFHEATGFIVKMSKTHPSGLLKQYQIDAAIETITKIKGAAT